MGASETEVSITSTPGLAIGPNPHRVSITFGCASGTLAVSTMSGLAAGEGFPVGVGTGPKTFDIREHGQIVQRAWYASSPATTHPLHIIEASVYKD